MARGRFTICAATLALLMAGNSYADKLVVFHNGRTLRVTELRQEEEWSFLTLGDKGEIGVPDRLIAAVLDVEGSGPVPLPNVQAAASSGGSRGGAAAGGVPRPNRPAGNRRGGAQATPPGEDPSAGGVVDEDARARAAKARGDALARAASRAGRERGANPEAGGAIPLEGELPPGTELGSPDSADNWPSLLDGGKRRDPSEPQPPREGESDD
jgi:hypothetical protein